MYTIRQLSDLAGVSVRTLHHYDHIGLLRPSQVGANQYRYYDDEALLRLQQILFYRELGVALAEIRDILDEPGFDLMQALHTHRDALRARIAHFEELIRTVDNTIQHLGGDQTMSKKQLFRAFSDEEQRYHERTARLEYGPQLVNESARRWNSYTSEQRQKILDEGNSIYADIVRAMEAEHTPHSAEVQALLVRWHEHLQHFYDPPLEVLRGLGQLYNSHPDFMANFQALHPGLAEFMEQAIDQYVDELETAEIARMLAEDEARNRQG